MPKYSRIAAIAGTLFAAAGSVAAQQYPINDDPVVNNDDSQQNDSGNGFPLMNTLILFGIFGVGGGAVALYWYCKRNPSNCSPCARSTTDDTTSRMTANRYSAL